MEQTTNHPSPAAPAFCTGCGIDRATGITTPDCRVCSEYSDSLQPPPTIPQHRYPLWLAGFGLLVVVAAIYSLTVLPPFWTAAHRMHTAEAAIQQGDRQSAERTLAEVLQQIPSSKSARLDMALLLLGNPSELDHRRALGYLAGLKLDKSDWARVSAALPPKYLGLFHSTGK